MTRAVAIAATIAAGAIGWCIWQWRRPIRWQGGWL